jgi:hypothetical protein
VAVRLRPDAAGPRDRLLHVPGESQRGSDEQRRRQVRLDVRSTEGRLALLGGPQHRLEVGFLERYFGLQSAGVDECPASATV